MPQNLEYATFLLKKTFFLIKGNFTVGKAKYAFILKKNEYRQHQVFHFFSNQLDDHDTVPIKYTYIYMNFTICIILREGNQLKVFIHNLMNEVVKLCYNF